MRRLGPVRDVLRHTVLSIQHDAIDTTCFSYLLVDSHMLNDQKTIEK